MALSEHEEEEEEVGDVGKEEEDDEEGRRKVVVVVNVARSVSCSRAVTASCGGKCFSSSKRSTAASGFSTVGC